ncbi:MAG: chorismate synthase [Candidatus Bipolaricaulia bacterium]
MEVTIKTAGESHGKGIIAMVEGFPSGLKLDKGLINEELVRRQGGYGRGDRMEIERDEVEVLSGFYQGESLGTPIVFWISNKDWENWEKFISPEGKSSEKKELNLPRPGHADLAGALKHGFRDCRRVLERTSARETAGRVAVGGLSRTLLNRFGIEVVSRVTGIGGVNNADGPGTEEWSERADESPVRVTDEEAEKKIIEEIEQAREAGDSLGGRFEVAALGVPPGLGSYSSSKEKLDAKIGAGFMSIPAIKSVEIGLGKEAGSKRGSEVHDEIYHDDQTGFYRGSNSAGGIEGGVSNGEAVVVEATMKPIPTLAKPLHSIDLVKGNKGEAARERSDVCAVPAASIVAEAEMANIIAGAFLDKFSGDSLTEVEESFKSHRERLEDWFGGD